MDDGHLPNGAAVSPEPVIDLDQVLDKFAGARWIKPIIRPLVARTLRVDRLSKDVADWEVASRSGSAFEILYRKFGVDINISSGDPATLAHPGPLVVVSNHPFGILDGLALARMAVAAGRQPKILASEFLTRIRPLRRYLITVDSFRTRDARLRNVAALMEAVKHLEGGGLLIVFPGGRVSHFRMAKFCVCDPPWSNEVIHLIRNSGASVLPVRFHGLNSFAFYAFGIVHPIVRALMLLREVYRAVDARRSVSLSIGELLPANVVLAAGDGVTPIDRLRRAVYALNGGAGRTGTQDQ
ncbi:MAG: 1-acyl-sn-glycerol-3-phosphate acyltransferase [Pseudolabrys sp.]